MLLQFETRRIEPDITIVELTGKLVLGPESRSVEKLVNDLLAQDRKKIALDLAAVEYIDSTGLGAIVQCFSVAKRAGGRLHVAGAKGQVERVFKTTKLDRVLPLFPTVEAACEAFTSVPGRSGP